MEHHWSNELLKDCTNAAKALEKLAHSTGFEPVTSAFGGQRSIHTRFARGWLLRTPTLSKLIEYIKILAEFECLSIGTVGTCFKSPVVFYGAHWSCIGVN